MASKKSTAVVNPNLGIYFDRAKIALNPRMLQDGMNFRVANGRLSNLNMGWDRFGSFQLNGPVQAIISFVLRGGTEELVFITEKDIYQYVNATTVTYITPRYEVGTAERTADVVTLAGGANLTSGDVEVGDEITFGTAGVVSTSATWHEITEVTDATHLKTATSGTVGSGPYTIRKVFTGSFLENAWQYDIFVNADPSNEDELWMTNGQDSIVRWNGTDTQVEEMSPSLGFTAKTLRVYNNMMIFANINDGGTNMPTTIINSDVSKPQNAGDAGTGLSEQFIAHPGVEEIYTLEPISDALAIYSKLNRVSLMQFVGDPLVFAFRQISVGTGLLGPNLVANFGNFHEFLAPDTAYFFDGATLKDVNNHVWRELLRQQDPARIQIGFQHFDQENGDLIWVVPTTSDPDPTNGGPSQAFGEHYLENPGQGLPQPFSRRSFPFTASGYFKRQLGLTWDQITTEWQNTNFRWNDRFFSASFPLNMVGDEDGKVYSINTSQDAAGEALASFVLFGRRALFDGRVRGLLTRVYPFVQEFVTPLSVTVQMIDSADGNMDISDTQSFDQTQPQGGHFTVHYRRGRYFETKFSSTGPSQPWSIAGYDVDIRPGGKR